MPKTIFIILIIFGLVLPMLVSAQGRLSGPIVPCGREGQNPCTLCDIFVVIQKIIDFITAGLFVIAGIFVAVGGVRILASAGSPEHVDAGKRMITSAITGIVIALLSWVILNMLFLGLFGEKKGFQWPWYEIHCVGGGITETEEQERELGSNICTCGENTLVGSRTFATQLECSSSCSTYCQTTYTGSGTYGCCESKVMEQGCFASPPSGQWCQRSAPSGSDKWKIGGPMMASQFGDANASLVNFINCMYDLTRGNRPNLIITAISSSVLCNNPACDTNTDNCGHVKNSCHFGGTNCKGASSAVDFATSNYSCAAIRDAAINWCGGSNPWINYEVDHVHISLNRGTCGCNESPNPTPCP